MDQIILKITPHGEKTVTKPFKLTEKPKQVKEKLMRAYNKAKMFKEYHNIAQCLYWVGELQFDSKMKRQFSGHMLAQARKVYALCKENPEWIGHMSRITLEDWTKTNIREAVQSRQRVRQVLDGARIYVVEDVNPQLNPNNPQQETAAAAWDDITWTLEDQFLGPGIESRDSEVVQEIDHPRETEDFGRTWEDLLGISEDIPENAGLRE